MIDRIVEEAAGLPAAYRSIWCGEYRWFYVVLAVVVLPLAVGAQVVPVGGEFQVNSYSYQTQASFSYQSVDVAPSGDFVIVWHSQTQDGSPSPTTGIFGRRYASDGTALASEFQVNTYTQGTQYNPAVDSDAMGNFVVVWRDLIGHDGDGAGIFAQRFDSAGTRRGTELQVNVFTTSNQDHPSVMVSADGSFLVAWADYQGALRARAFDGGGMPAGGETTIDTTGYFPKLASAACGEAVVVWSAPDGSSDGVFASRLGANGAPVGSSFQVNAFTSGDQSHPAVAAGSDGAFVVVWHSFYQDGSQNGVFGRRYDSAGTPIGSEFQANSHTFDQQGSPTVAMDAGGNFAVVWNSNQDGSSLGVFAQRFESQGLPVGIEFQVNTVTTGQQGHAAVDAAPQGNFVVTWAGPDNLLSLGVFAQRFAVTPVGSVTSPACNATITPTDTPVATSTPTSSSTVTVTETVTATASISHTPTVTPTPTNTVIPLCVGGPFSTCKVAGVTKLIVRNHSDDDRDKLKFSWIRGALTTPDELGDPTLSTQYSLCIWDEASGTPNLVMEMVAPPGGNCAGRPCWKAIGGGSGFKFKDLGLLPHGIQQLVVKAEAQGKSKVQVKGFGQALPDPSMPFLQDQKITAQLVNSLGHCWGADFVTGAAINTTEILVVKERP